MVTGFVAKECETNNTLVANNSNGVDDRHGGPIPKAIEKEEERNKQ